MKKKEKRYEYNLANYTKWIIREFILGIENSFKNSFRERVL